ncbi:Hypothetical predicted protein [Marmota monax]|uniref:Uncharacterized protein n=1 Tax=Marmota monax TaxID=9995 RepID=A0A5E4D4N8_MARMO|nr:Hypothetical predicted protein [Marmota monax]
MNVGRGDRDRDGAAVGARGRRPLPAHRLQPCSSLTCALGVYLETNLSLAAGVSLFPVIFILKLNKQKQTESPGGGSRPGRLSRGRRRSDASGLLGLNGQGVVKEAVPKKKKKYAVINPKVGTASLGSPSRFGHHVAPTKAARRPFGLMERAALSSQPHFLEPGLLGGFCVHWNSVLRGLPREVEPACGSLLLSPLVMSLPLRHSLWSPLPPFSCPTPPHTLTHTDTHTHTHRHTRPGTG